MLQKRRIVFDLEANGLHEVENMLTKIHCIVAKDIDTKEVFTFSEDLSLTKFHLNDFKKLLKKCSVVIGHNIINYDLRALETILGIKFSIAEMFEGKQDFAKQYGLNTSDTIDGEEVFIYDTLVMSKLLDPKRLQHGLDAWGKKLGILKGDFGKQDNAWENFTKEMLDYCIQDVDVNEAVYFELEKERKEDNWDWDLAFWIEKATADIISRQSMVGFYFNRNLAETCVEELNGLLKDIEDKVEPLLPEKPLTKSETPNFPKDPFDKDGNINHHGYNWLERQFGFKVDRAAIFSAKMPKRLFKSDLSVTDAALNFLNKAEESGFVLEGDIEQQLEAWVKKKEVDPLGNLQEKGVAYLKEKRMPNLMKPMKMSDQSDIKALLATKYGWKPLNYKDKDLTLDSNKNKLNKEKYLAAANRYIEETEQSPFKQDRMEQVKAKNWTDFINKLLTHDISRPLKVITQPTYTEGNDKDKLCPSLVRLGSKVSFVKDVVHWLTYRHRRNSILSPNGGGFLADDRLNIDGRISTPADTCGAATSRFTHRRVANIPRVTSLYGDKMRDLFCVDTATHLQMGCDADGLEARIEGHYCYKYKGGEKYAVALVAEKPNDLHTTNAVKFDVPRDDAKSLKYALSYGASAPKVAKQMGWTLKRAEEVVDMFWVESSPLADFKEAAIAYWKKTDKRYVKGIDGRKLKVRSQHSIVNLLFQSAGVLCMKVAMILWDRWVTKENLDVEQLIAYHDEVQMQDLKSNFKFKTFETKEDAVKWKSEEEARTGLIYSDIKPAKKGFFVAYNRGGHYAAKSITEGGRFFDLNVELTGGYMVGRSWKDCH